jgi:HK97 family phage major capsid protein
MLKAIMERRAALHAALEALNAGAVNDQNEARSFNDAENTEFDAGMAELAKLDERIAELQEAEKRSDAAAAHRAPAGTPTKPVAVVVNEPNPVYRRGDLTTSFFKDKAAVMLQRSDLGAGRSIPEARARLEASQETRAGDLTTVAGAGGQFAPPLWLIQDFVPLARAARVAADLMNQDVLPQGVSSINLPTVTGGATVAVQALQNTAASDTAMTTGSVTSGITTITGKQIVSLQLLQQSGIPFDKVVLGDLARAYATQLDAQVLAGSGAAGQLRGLANGAGVGAIAYTTVTPAVTSATAANSFYNKVIAAIAGVNTNLFLPPTAIIMHPNRWAWVLEALDTATRPLVVPNGPQFNGVANSEGADVAQGPAGSMAGLPVYIDPSIPTGIGAGTNQDVVYVLRQDQCWLYESELQEASFDATYADQASILFRVLGYSAFIPDRYGKAVYAINGTGLVAPAL